MNVRAWLGVVLATLVAMPAAAAGVGDADRLDRFRALTVAALGAGPPVDPERAAAALREIWALLDDEMVESLEAGGVFASLPFLQERLDGFAEAWGGASFRLQQVGSLTVGAFQLSEGGGGATVRVYGRLRAEAALLTILARDGRPSVYVLPATRDGAGQFLAAWEGAPSGRGTRALRLDLVRQRADGTSVVWSTAEAFSDGLVVRDWGVRAGDVRVRYELHYPGWVPGCEGQTEQEDVYRLSPDHSTFVRASRRQFNSWHQAFHRVVDRVLSALGARDRAAVATAVPDARLRARLPVTLTSDTACDAADAAAGAGAPVSVSTAALAADGRPWTLTWRRTAGQWRLTSASPLLE